MSVILTIESTCDETAAALVDSDRRIVAVPFSAAGLEPAFGKPTPLFADEYDFGQGISIVALIGFAPIR